MKDSTLIILMIILIGLFVLVSILTDLRDTCQVYDCSNMTFINKIYK